MTAANVLSAFVAVSLLMGGNLDLIPEAVAIYGLFGMYLLWKAIALGAFREDG